MLSLDFAALVTQANAPADSLQPFHAAVLKLLLAVLGLFGSSAVTVHVPVV